MSSFFSLLNRLMAFVAKYRYPRHFGITFTGKADFEAALHHAQANELAFFQEPMIRFEGLREEHRTFFLIDPSNNLIEFK